jgi:hypothetical protein
VSRGVEIILCSVSLDFPPLRRSGSLQPDRIPFRLEHLTIDVLMIFLNSHTRLLHLDLFIFFYHGYTTPQQPCNCPCKCDGPACMWQTLFEFLGFCGVSITTWHRLRMLCRRFDRILRMRWILLSLQELDGQM